MPFEIHEEIARTVSYDCIQFVYLKDKISFRGPSVKLVRYKRKQDYTERR